MRHIEVFTGRVGQLRDLVELANNNCVLNFSVAETPRVKKGDNWEDGVTVWTEVTIFGDEARNFQRSVKPGTFVTIIGNRTAREYTPKDSNESRVTQGVVAEQVAIAITKFTYVAEIGNVNYAKGETGRSQSTGNSNANSTSTPKQNTRVNEDPFDDMDNDDPFAAGEDPFEFN